MSKQWKAWQHFGAGREKRNEEQKSSSHDGGGPVYGAVIIATTVAGILLIAAGIVLWFLAIFGAKIDAAFLFFCTGALLVYGNLWLLVLPPVYWLFLTGLMKCTEEKWLKNLYGREYEEYCRRVNRCIPWFSKKNGRR